MDDDEVWNGTLDAEVERAIFGGDVIRAHGTGAWGYRWKDSEGIIDTKSIPCYSTDIAAAWAVAERLREVGLGVLVSSEPDGWEVEITTTEALYQQGYQGCYAKADTAAEAICRGALLSFKERRS